MGTLIIDYDKKKNIIKEDYKSINKNFLTIEDLNLIDNYKEDYDYILIKKGDLKKRQDFNLDNFQNQEEIDIYILSTYNEKCQNLNKDFSQGDYTFYQSRMPGEIEALMFKSEKWPMIKNIIKNSAEEKVTKALKNIAYNEELNMAFSWPQAYYREDKKMMKICRDETIGLIEPKVKTISYYWFFLNLFFSILFLYIIYDKIPKDRFYYMDTKNKKIIKK